MTQPTLTREGIATALFSLLQTIPGVVTFSRTWKNFDQVPAGDQPALFLSKGDERVQQQQSGLLPIWRYEYLVTLYCYQQSSNNSIPPAAQINNLLDAIEAVLRPITPPGPPGMSGVQVLGDTTGRIRHAWIGDTVISDEGVLGPQSFILFPIEVEFA